MKTFSHKRPMRDADGTIVGQKDAPASRVTVDTLGGAFGRDKRRRLVVTLKAGDVLEFRPERTRQAVTLLATDCYQYALRLKANKAVLEKARGRKAAKAVQRESRRNKAAERRLTRPII